MQYYIQRCLGPCVAGLTTDEIYAEAARDTRTFLEGRRHDLIASLRERMAQASAAQQYEQAASYRDLLRTIEDIEERQKIAAAAGDDTDVLAWYAEPPQVAVNLFHFRGGRVVDRRDFYWEDLDEFDPAEFLPSLLKQLYLDAALSAAHHSCAEDFEDRAAARGNAQRTRRHARPAVPPRRYHRCRSAAQSTPFSIWSKRTRATLSSSAFAC